MKFGILAMGLLFGSVSLIVGVGALLIYNYTPSGDPAVPVAVPVLVSTSFGQLQGVKVAARSGRLFNSFKAVPYAKPPIGERRFKVPEEYGSWKGVRDATLPIPMCFQASYLIQKQIVGKEDCLILNVYTPHIPDKGTADSSEAGLLPVMVFFHGGHFMGGSSEAFGPEYFMDEDVVLVTVNYRLGALGFLNTGDDVVSGNMGLKDQVLALKWIQAAIRDFGGDKNLVTIFGESAGGSSVDLHILSPLSKNLFHRAISQSGSSLCPWAYSSNTQAAAKIIRKKLGCPAESESSSEQLVNCLRTVDALKIVETHVEIFSPLHAQAAVFGPSVEHVKEASSAFLAELPSKILAEGRQASKVPILLGVTSEEGCYRSAAIIDTEWATQLHDTWGTHASNLFIYDKKRHNDVGPKILQYYFGVGSPPSFNKETYVQFTQALSDRYFFKCTKDAADAHSAAALPTYFYWLSHKTKEFGFGDLLAGVSTGNQHLAPSTRISIAYWKKRLWNALGWETFDYGVCHVDDLRYIFRRSQILEISTSSVDYAFSRAVVKAWVNFAKDGAPGKFMGVKWEKMVSPGKEQDFFMNLEGHRPSMIKEPFASGSKFWNSLNLS